MKNTLKLVRTESLDLAFDVSAESLNFALKSPDGSTIEGQCGNDSLEIRNTLRNLQHRTRQQFNIQPDIRVICESTGVYHKNLLAIAAAMGLRTNLVSPEAVAHCRRLIQNDHNKNDTADARTILQVADMGHVLPHRRLGTQWATLREMHRALVAAEEKARALRNELHAEVRTLFPDLRVSGAVRKGPTFAALITLYGANPSKITQQGRAKFMTRMQKASPHSKRPLLETIYTMAEQSTCAADPTLREIQAEQIRFQFSLLTQLDARKQQLESQMIELTQQLRDSGAAIPTPQKAAMSDRLLARLFAEIGSPDDFQSYRQLQRYAGLNLLENHSGKFRGRTRISRRGRSRIRHVLNLMALPLTRRDALYGAYYHSKLKAGMPGQKAMVAVMRKLLKMVYGLMRTREEFDRDRVHTSEAEYRRNAG